MVAAHLLVKAELVVCVLPMALPALELITLQVLEVMLLDTLEAGVVLFLLTHREHKRGVMVLTV
jgi:hypothetical protein